MCAVCALYRGEMGITGTVSAALLLSSLIFVGNMGFTIGCFDRSGETARPSE